ncbi:MAG: polysaccharide biosynthesis C-terminal domain-containing protein, partial [Muribaculaceae bacterium]|nr:polysaccharide biosynthesis C-terminal domain-containing protein [Muribaculaceae bacterium]
LNVILVPRMGYMGCAWAAIACYGAMMVASYVIGQSKFPVPYRLGRLAVYAIAALGLYGLGVLTATSNDFVNMGIGTLYIIAYIALVWRLELRGVNLRSLLRK